MNRRDALRILAGTAAIPVLPEELLALGRALRALGREGHVAFQVLDPHQRETVATIAELIIPATDTPGARAAGVVEFIDLMLAEWYDDADRERFLSGVADVDTRAQSLFNKKFVECPAALQNQILTTFDQEATLAREAARGGASRGEKAGRPFFAMMKHLTVVGYYTSEIGATRELHYQVIPGRYDGCVPVAARGE